MGVAVAVIVVTVVVAVGRCGVAALPAAHDQANSEQGDEQPGADLEPGYEHPGHHVVAGGVGTPVR